MSLSQVPIGKNAPEIINVVIEIPRGNHHKYEYDVKMDAIKLDRVLHSAVFYPADYGFIPHTLSEDGDHLDVLVLITDPVFPGCVVEARPIGMLDMEDEAGRDWKIIAVADKDPKMEDMKAISDIDKHYRKEIEVFFRNYKELENKKVEVKNWLSKEEAVNRIEKAMKKYLEETL
jgi:inorganic pyrophosphatase